jgi:predicted membrane protein
VAHGFVRAANGTITTFSAPGAAVNGTLASLLQAMGSGPPTQGTGALSINTAGTIAGAYAKPTGIAHGFVRATSGVITEFSVPGAGTGTLQGTLAIGINTAGAVVGTYVDAKKVFHGFLRSP